MRNIDFAATRGRFVCDCGCPKKATYSSVLRDDGQIELVPSDLLIRMKRLMLQPRLAILLR